MQQRKFIFFPLLLISIMIIIPAFFIGRSFGIFQNEKVISKYVIVYQVNNKLYDINLWSTSAIDKKIDDNCQFYTQTSNPEVFNKLIKLAYNEFETEDSSLNPYLNGYIRYPTSSHNYTIIEKKYNNATEYQTYISILNKNKDIIYSFNSEDKKGRYIKEIIHAGMSRSSGGRGSSAVIDPYLNVSKLFIDKLNKKINIQVDENKKIVILKITDI